MALYSTGSLPPSGRGKGSRNPGSLSGRLPSQSGGGSRSARGRSSGPTGDPQSWEGRSFYVQVERCSGLGDTGMSVRHDEEKYLRHSKAIKDGIETFFDRQLPVAIIDVQTPYSMEIRVMPDDCHPRHGQRVIGKERCVEHGARTIFSKIENKKWPKLEAIIGELMSFCRVPAQISLYGREIRASADVAPNCWAAQGINSQAVNGGAHGASTYSGLGHSGDVKAPLPHVPLLCTHATSGTAPPRPTVTDSDGRAEVILFPGNFAITCEVNSNYDRLTPNIVTIPARFEPLDVVVTASMKKQCGILVVDQYNKPFARFPIKLVPKDPALGTLPITLRTKLDGKCKTRLGRGCYVAQYFPDGHGNEHGRIGGGARSDWPVKPFSQDMEVQDSDLPQLFRVAAHRVRFVVEVMLRTTFGASPSRVPFSVRADGDDPFWRSESNDIGVAVFDAPPGKYLLELEPSDDSPFVQAFTEVTISENGTFTPLDCGVQTKNVDIKINLVTPDGLPATHCEFHLSPQFGEPGRSVELAFRSDAEGTSMCTMGLLEPYMFKVKNTGKVMEYMPQRFAFQIDRRSFTAVVARSVFSHISEDNVVFVLDTSGSMQGYIEDVKIAMNTALLQQFHKTQKRFSIVTFTDKQVLFRKELVDSSVLNMESAMRFCECIEAGGLSSAAKAFDQVFSFKDMEAAYFITDGKCEVGESLINRLKSLYFSHPKRPKVHTIGINCIPRRLTWRGLESLAALTQASFRPICLQQSEVDPLAPLLAMRQGGLAGLDGRMGFDLATGDMGLTTDDDQTGGEEMGCDDSLEEFNFTSDDAAY